MVSFLTTFAVDIIYGVGVGFIYSILTVVFRSQYGGRFLLGEAKNTDLYSELKRFEEVVQQFVFLRTASIIIVPRWVRGCTVRALAGSLLCRLREGN